MAAKRAGAAAAAAAAAAVAAADEGSFGRSALRRHAGYLTSFLQQGFEALQKLEAISHWEGGGAEGGEEAGGLERPSPPLLPGLGPDRAARLLATCAAEPSTLSAVYWAVCALNLLGESLPPALQERTVAFVLSCRRQSGGFAPHPDHPASLLSTLSGIQLCLLLGRRDLLAPGAPCEAPGSVRYVRSLRLGDGSYCGREGALEGDSRFVYAALNALCLLRAEAGGKEEGAAPEGAAETAAWVLRCQNLDGGFGCRPDGECESHAGHAFCGLASLALLRRQQLPGEPAAAAALPARSRGRLVRWLCDRQCHPEGGLNGRPGKAPDACYTWWTLASVELLRAAGGSPGLELGDFVRAGALREFLGRCECGEGGVAAHPGDDPDPFHTFFGLAGLSLLEHGGAAAAGRGGGVAPALARIDPALALPCGALGPAAGP